MKVSIIITNYNYSSFLDRCIRSAFVQNFTKNEFEIIVVDDASTDSSRTIINSYKNLINAILLKKNSGLSNARNIGIQNAKSDYIVFIDADDYIHRDMIKMQYTFLKYNLDWDAIAVDYFTVDDNEEHIERENCEKNPIACGIMYRKKHLIDVGMYDDNFKIHEDIDFRIRFLKNFNINRLALPLYRYRKHGNSLTDDKELSNKYIKKLNKKHR